MHVHGHACTRENIQCISGANLKKKTCWRDHVFLSCKILTACPHHMLIRYLPNYQAVVDLGKRMSVSDRYKM